MLAYNNTQKEAQIKAFSDSLINYVQHNENDSAYQYIANHQTINETEITSFSKTAKIKTSKLKAY